MLAAIYITVGSLGSLLLLSSVVAELFFRHAPAGMEDPTPLDQLSCNKEVEKLLSELGQTASDIQRDAAVGVARGRDVGESISDQWEAFSRDWQRQWETVNARCKFDELADTDLGQAYDRMAWVHRRLPGLKLEYKELMKQFTDKQADELAEMREALTLSRKLLEQRAETPPN